jgi:hypothetical protein
MISSIHSKKGDYGKALAEAALALENDKKIENSPGIVQDLAAVASITAKLGDNERAYSYCRRAYETAVAAGLEAAAKKCLERLVSAAKALNLAEDAAAWQKLLDSGSSPAK